MIQGKNNDQIKPFYLVKNKRMSFDFPDVSDSLKNPNGLLAIGGDLSEKNCFLLIRKEFFLGLMKVSLFYGGHQIQGA